MRIPFALSLVALAAACAQTPAVPYEKLAQEQAVSGFRVAVIDVCLESALKGVAVAELATETGPIVAETDAALVTQARAKPGDRVWSSREADGVLIRSGMRECEVTTRGPLTRAALDAVGEALADPHGFVAETPAEPKGGNVYKRYSKKVGAQTFFVTLSGSQPGVSPGMLAAMVTSSAPATLVAG